MSVRFRLALSYAAVIVVTGALMIAVVWLFLPRYVPEYIDPPVGLVPNRWDLKVAFLPKALMALGYLLVLGSVVGWLLAGLMLAPLKRIGEAANLASQGSLSHRIDLKGSNDEFRKLSVVFNNLLGQLEEQLAEREVCCQLLS